MKQKKATSGQTDFLLEIIHTIRMGIVAVEMDGTIRIMNRMASEILSISEVTGMVEGRQIFHLIDPASTLYEHLDQSLKNGGAGINLKGIKYNNCYITVVGKKIMNNYILTINNITDLKEMEAHAISSMLKGQETERKRLSKEIHDGLAPLLSTIKISLEAFQMEIEKDPINPSLKRKLENIHELIDSMAKDMRHVSHALMPKVLEDFGVGPALESLCNRLNNSDKIHVHYYDAGFDERLEKSVELNVYRIAQELLNNSLKHSGASQVNIQLIRHRDSVMLMLEDNGIGFNKDQVMQSTQGIGLKNIETRTKMTGGIFYLDTSPGKGVTATLEIPVKQS